MSFALAAGQARPAAEPEAPKLPVRAEPVAAAGAAVAAEQPGPAAAERVARAG